MRSGSNPVVPTPRCGAAAHAEPASHPANANAAVRLRSGDISSVVANELPIAVNRSPNLSAEDRRRVLRDGLWINLFAAATLGFAFGLALWV